MSQNTSSAVMAQRHEAHDSLEDFPTPPWATRALMEQLASGYGMPRETRIWEPACNRGYMADALREYVDLVIASDIHDYGIYAEQRDFLFPGHDHAYDVDWIITNPPFRLADQFAHKAFTIAKQGVGLFVRTAFLEGIGRYRSLFTPRRPSAVLQFTERVVLHKGKLTSTGSTATAYCWIVWRAPSMRTARRSSTGSHPAASASSGRATTRESHHDHDRHATAHPVARTAGRVDAGAALHRSIRSTSMTDIGHSRFIDSPLSPATRRYWAKRLPRTAAFWARQQQQQIAEQEPIKPSSPPDKPSTDLQAPPIIISWQPGEPPRPRVAEIIEACARHAGIGVDELTSPQRHRRLIRPRQAAVYLATKWSGRSLPEIGRRVGGRDHSTVLHSKRKVQDDLDDGGKVFGRLIEQVERELGLER